MSEQAGPARPNPSLRLDPALGLVVIEFRNDNGGVSQSIPTVRQLEAYKRSQQTGPAPTPQPEPPTPADAVAGASADERR